MILIQLTCCAVLHTRLLSRLIHFASYFTPHIAPHLTPHSPSHSPSHSSQVDDCLEVLTTQEGRAVLNVSDPQAHNWNAWCKLWAVYGEVRGSTQRS